MRATLLKTQIEQTLPDAFTVYQRKDRGSIPTGIPCIDETIHGVPLHALSEIYGGNPASSGKTSVLVSLLAQATRDRFCALVDAGDNFDPVSGQAAGIDLPRLLWVRCGKSCVKLPPLEQAFKVADILLQSGGFGLIGVDISDIPEKIVRKIPLSTWFRFSRVIERQPAALVFVSQQPHAASCAGLVLRVNSGPPVLRGNLFAGRSLSIEIVRSLGKKPVCSERELSVGPNFSSASNPTTELQRYREEVRIEKKFPLDFSPCLCDSGVDLSSPAQWA
jgi:recombination protein RecA